MASNTLPTSLSRLLNVTGETVGMFKRARKLFMVVSPWPQKSKAEILKENINDKNTYNYTNISWLISVTNEQNKIFQKFEKKYLHPI